jgi:hypothetical protein
MAVIIIIVIFMIVIVIIVIIMIAIIIIVIIMTVIIIIVIIIIVIITIVIVIFVTTGWRPDEVITELLEWNINSGSCSSSTQTNVVRRTDIGMWITYFLSHW